MSRNTIVAVGGTGTHAAIAFLRMAIMSNMDIANVPNIIVIDGDTTRGGDNSDRQLSLLESANALYNQVVEGVKETARPYFKHFKPYNEYAKTAQIVYAKTGFGEYLVGQSIELAPESERQILDALFTREPNKQTEELSEQEILIKDGFYARPSVGSSALYDLLSEGGERVQGDLTHCLRSALGMGNNFAGIVVVGSSTGGTGSGGAPSIAQWLVKEKTRAKRADAKIALFMSLPWFYPAEPNDPATEEASYGSKATQRINSAAGIRLYAQSETLQDAGVFIADYNGIEQIRENDGNSGQKENPHAYSLMLASQMQNFFLAAENKADKGVVGEYTFFHPTEAGESFKIKASNSALVAFSSNNDTRQEIESWAVETQTMRIVLSKLAHMISLGYRIAAGAEQRPREESFKKMMVQLSKMLGHDLVKGGGILGFGQREIESQIVRDKLVQYLRARETELSESIAWLATLVKNSEISERRTFEIAASAVQKALAPDACKNYPIFGKTGDPTPTVLKVFDRAFNVQATKNSNSNASDIEQSLKTLCDEGGLLPEQAATILIERQIRELMRHENIAKNQTNQRSNDHLPVSLQGKLATYLIPLRGVGEQEVNHYLASINLKQLVDNRSDRNGVNRLNTDPAHPFTITGITSSAIPSPWASANLQGWLQDLGNEEQQLAAKKRFEAITWGIFTKRLELKKLNLSTRLGGLLRTSLQAELGAAALANQTDLLVACDRWNSKNVVAVNHPKVGWYLAPWLLELEQDSHPHQWWALPQFNQDVAYTLPSEIVVTRTDTSDFELRQVKSYLDYLKNLQSHHVVDAVNRKPVPWHSMVSSLIVELEPKLANVQAVPVKSMPGFILNLYGRNHVTNAFEYQSEACTTLDRSLLDILADYVPKQLISVEMDSPSGKTIRHPNSPVFSKFSNIVTANLVSSKASDASENLDFDFVLSYVLQIEGLGVTGINIKSKKELLGSHVVLFPNFVEDDWNYYYLGSTPGNRIDIADDIHFSMIDSNGRVIGQKSRTFRTNHEFQGVPKFLALESTVNNAFGECGLFAIPLDKIQGANLSFKLGLDMGTSHSCFYPLTNNNQRIEAVNFTTAAQDLSLNIFQADAENERMVEDVTFLGLYSAGETDTDTLVLPSEIRVQKREGEPVTSNMLHQDEKKNKERGKHFSTTPLKYSNPISSTKSNEPGYFLTDFKWASYDHGANAAHHGLRATAFETGQPEILNIYLLQFLTLGFAQLRKNRFKTLNVFRATYPEAFDLGQVKDYAEQLERVFAEISLRTGIKIVLTIEGAQEVNKVKATDLLTYVAPDKADGGPLDLPNGNESCMVSESLAAIGAAPQGELLGAGRGVCVILDMGGGTTDMAVYASGENGAVIAELKSITDSIQYAGNDVLAMLNTPAVLTLMQNAVAPGAPHLAINDENQRMLTIKRLMRNPRVIPVLRQALTTGPFNKNNKSIEAFFLGMIEYAKINLIPYKAAFEKEHSANPYWSIKVVLLGNGWRLADLIWDQGRAPVERFITDMKKELSAALGTNADIEISFAPRHNVSVKEAIAMGAITLGAQGNRIAGLNPQLATAAFPLMVKRKNITAPTDVLADTQYQLDARAAEFLYPQGIEVNGLDPIGADLFERFLLLKNETNQARIKTLLTATMNTQISNRIQSKSSAERSNLKLNPFSIFLETIWKYACITHATPNAK